MYKCETFQPFIAIRSVFITLLNFLLLAAPAVAQAHGGHSGHGGHGGHGHEFQGGSEATSTNSSIQVDPKAAQRMGIKISSVQRQRLAVGIKTTGQIETLPSKQVEVTAPIPGIVAQLLVEPGAKVKKGQPIALLYSPDLVTLRVESQEKLAQSQADLQQAQADLKLAQQNYERYQQIASAEIASAQSLVAFAQEKYERDTQLADNGALPRRNALESQTKLAEAQASLTKASSRRDVIEAENQLKRASAAVEVAKSRFQLSNATYETRLQQLGNRANAKGLVTVTAPIAGQVADRPATLGQSFEDAGGKLMTIVNDSRVYATANIYEKDLGKVRTGQRVSVKVASSPNLTFTGRIAVISSVVVGSTRVVPVKAEIENLGSVLKPGMFASLEVLTNHTSTDILAIPSSAVVEANGKKLVYVQNGIAFQPVEVTLGQTSGNMVEVKTGLFEGDSIVTQRANQLYAQSLRAASNPIGAEGGHHHGHHSAGHTEVEASMKNNSGIVLPWWAIPTGGAIAVAAFMVGRRSKPGFSSKFKEIKSISPGVVSVRAVSADESLRLMDNHRGIYPESEVSNYK